VIVVDVIVGVEPAVNGDARLDTGEGKADIGVVRLVAVIPVRTFVNKG
jgi:hypothetical protein